MELAIVWIVVAIVGGLVVFGLSRLIRQQKAPVSRGFKRGNRGDYFFFFLLLLL